MSNLRKEESDDSGIDSIFSMLNDMEEKINGVDLSALNVDKNEFKKESCHYDLVKEFQKLENDREINRSHPEMMNNMKQVMILLDAVKQFMPKNDEW